MRPSVHWLRFQKHQAQPPKSQNINPKAPNSSHAGNQRFYSAHIGPRCQRVNGWAPSSLKTQTMIQKMRALQYWHGSLCSYLLLAFILLIVTILVSLLPQISWHDVASGVNDTHLFNFSKSGAEILCRYLFLGGGHDNLCVSFPTKWNKNIGLWDPYANQVNINFGS